MSQLSRPTTVAMEIDDPETVLAALDGAAAVVDPVAHAASAAGVTSINIPDVQQQQRRRADRSAIVALWRSRQGVLARGDQRCMICGLRWQRSDRAAAGGSIYLFPCPSGSEWTRWKVSLKLPSRQMPRRGERVCSLHFRPGETRVLLINGHRLAHTLPVAAPKRVHFDERSRAPARTCSFPLCRGLRQQLLDVLMDIQQRGSSSLRRSVRPYWSRRRFALPEPGPVNQAWVELFSEALNGRPNLPDQVELASLCALHFTPNWFRWENRGRPRLLDDPIGDPKLEKYAEPTVFSSTALIRALRSALHEDLEKQEEQRLQQKQTASAVKPKKSAPPASSLARAGNKIRCGYPYCEGGTILFPLPADRDQRKLWLRSLSAVLIAFGEPPGFDIKTCTHLCSFHFNEEEIENEDDGTITLSADAVPSRFSRPSVELEEPTPIEAEPVKMISWPDQLTSLIADAVSSEQQQQQEQEQTGGLKSTSVDVAGGEASQEVDDVSSEEDVVDVEEDSGFLPRLELQIAVDPETGPKSQNDMDEEMTADGSMLDDGESSITTGVDSLQYRPAASSARHGSRYDNGADADYVCSPDDEDDDDDENWRPDTAGTASSRSRAGRGRGGRSRGRPRGRSRGLAYGARDLSTPPPPAPISSTSTSTSHHRRTATQDLSDTAPPPQHQQQQPSIDPAAIDVSGAAAEVVRQSAALADAALAGNWASVCAVDSLRVAAYGQNSASTVALPSTADQLLKLCLIRRLRRAAASAAVAAVSSQQEAQSMPVSVGDVSTAVISSLPLTDTHSQQQQQQQTTVVSVTTVAE